MDKFQNKYRIPSARANWHDYNGGIYFITICTKYRVHYFGEIELNGDMVEMPQCGNMVSVETPQCGNMVSVETPQCGNMVSVETPQCDVSTNDTVNATMRNVAKQCGRLSHIISQFKSAVIKYAKQKGIEFAWQTRCHDHIVRDQEEYNRIANYIKNNVANWHNDKHK